VPYQLLADAVLAVHFGVVLFVVGGLVVVVVGNRLGWKWVNDRAFRLAHLAAIAIVVAQAWLGQRCSLTTLESWLRVRAGGSGYETSFIEHWLQRIVYYDAPLWVFAVAYTIFAMMVLAAWWYFPPRRHSRVEPLPSPSAVVAELAARGIDVPPGPVRVGAYGDSPQLSAELLALIRSGRKRAGTALLWAMEADNESIPTVDEIEVVVDHRGQPALITRIASVQVVPYREVTAEYAAIEGEGDGSLEYWRKAHWAFFSRECRRIGRRPSQTMPVVCSVFELLRVLTAGQRSRRSA
jgi:uncharacterized protein YhfF